MTTENTNENVQFPTDRRPFGFWLKAVDRRLSAEMEALFASDGITRRDWRLLNLLGGDAVDERLAERLARKPRILERLAERGWIDAEAPTPTLTDEGRTARERLLDQVQALRARVAGAVSPEDFQTTVATLEKIARELGWDENAKLPRGRRGGRRFGYGHPHRGHDHDGFGPARFDRAGFGPRRDERCADGERRRGERPARPGREFRKGFGPGFAPGFRPGFGPAAGPEVHVHVHVHEGRRHGRGHGRPGRPEPRV
ncbi:MarR family winged helix-turn-helix transcriptional regulator [Agromyces protaetiae]|uniref:MarR family winged helix-turn-helix transcriptional regulator n=1 Tax=Agromyces protaetiae TaxID=2509455 RepID=UPI001AA02FBD|nr:MarR family winged helix-turn-helix transcriptional regulator [Agromyces protaetiae]